MSDIRLIDVTRVFRPSSGYGSRLGRGAGGVTGTQADRAFADRAKAVARQEAELRGSSGGDVHALDHVNLNIPDGETFAIVGPSGCGKSTLLRVLAGLDLDYTGDVLYDGQDVRDVPPKDRYIGMVFQNYALYPHFEGEGNLRFFFRVRKAPDTEAEERIRATSEIMGFGFEQLLQRKPGTLSGGQQQRLAIGRALVRKPRLFLFDEPLSNLDAKLRAQTRVEIKRLLRRIGITAVYVTHDQEEAVSLGDQIAVMREGRVEQVGPYSLLRERPANVFVAGFLGMRPMNLVEGRVQPDGVLRCEGLVVPLPPGMLDRYGPSQKLTMGVRPEAASLTFDGDGKPGDLVVNGEIETIEPDYVRRAQYFRVRCDADVLVAMVSIEERWRTGESIRVLFPADSLYFFEGESGRRIT